MSLLFADGCDWYSVAADILKKWGNRTGNSTFSGSAGRFGAGAITIPAGNTYELWTPAVYAFGTENDNRFGFSMKITSIPSNGSYNLLGIAVDSVTNPNQFLLSLKVFGSVINIQDPMGSTYGDINLYDGSWHWIEGTFDATTRITTIYVDGTSDLTFTASTNQMPAAGTALLFGNGLTTGSIILDDVIVWNGNGTGLTASNIGLQRIVTLTPTSDGSQADFALSAGVDHYALVDEAGGNDDTDYVESGTSTDEDLYGYSNLPADPNIIGVTAVVVNNYVKNPGTGSIAYKSGARSGTTSGYGPSRTPIGSYTTIQDVFMVNPDTSAAWTTGEVDGAEFGVKVD